MSAENDGLGIAAESVSDTIKNRYLTFIIDQEQYGIEIANVTGIEAYMKITKIPHSQDYVEGIFNLRGDIIGVLNVRKRFFKPEKEPDDLTCIIIIEHSNYILGLIVDSVDEVATIEEENISPPPSAKLNHYNQYIKNIGRIHDDVVLLLDLEKLLLD